MSGATGRATQLLLPRGGMIRSDRVKSFGDGRTPFSFLPASTPARYSSPELFSKL